MEKALLVTIKIRSEKDYFSLDDAAIELEELAHSSGAEVLDNIVCNCEKPTANLLIGSGKAEELAAVAQEMGADTLIFSHDLSGTQQRNLEDVVGRKTIDRTQLILDIFSRHARSPEGKTQVELAQLEYLLPRLIGKGVILSRLGGGIGTRGPGEQKLEVDRRRIRKRIEKLKEDLNHVRLHRELIRKKRKENALPSVALVGYTSAGKSTLLNSLTEAGQVVSKGLFTTLDPLSKSLQLENGERMVISDTVGFLHNLPHNLIDAFKATLEEVLQADLLVHVLDIANPLHYEHNRAVFDVLKELKAENKPIITALNKIDLIEDREWLKRIEGDFVNSVPVSSQTKENLNMLLENIQRNFAGRMQKVNIMIPHSRMDLVNLFHKEGKVYRIEYLQKGIKIELSLPKILYLKLLHNKEIVKYS